MAGAVGVRICKTDTLSIEGRGGMMEIKVGDTIYFGTLLVKSINDPDMKGRILLAGPNGEAWVPLDAVEWLMTVVDPSQMPPADAK
jgi:hypothetical protein